MYPFRSYVQEDRKAEQEIHSIPCTWISDVLDLLFEYGWVEPV